MRISVLLSIVLLFPSQVDGRPIVPRCSTPQELRAQFTSVSFACPGCGVLLIDLDGLRADRLGYAGYSGGVSPFIDSLAKRGIVFRNAMAQSSWTYPSAASVVTSQYPSAHGAGRTAAVLSRSLPTIFSISKAKGYRVLGDDRRPFVWDKKMMMDVSENSFENPGYAAELNSAVEALSASPTLAYLINMDLHRPYLRISAPAAPAADPDAALYLAHVNEHRRDLTDGASADVIAAVNRLYDRRVRYVDGRIEALIGALEKKGLFKRTIVVLYSNHGELIFEHSLWGHGYGYSDEEIHVPFILLHPSVNEHNAAAVCQEIELIDLAPTLFEMLGFGVPSFGRGRSLVPLLKGRADESSFKYAFSEAANLASTYRNMVRTNEWKLLSTVRDSYQLFDLAHDPSETRDVKAEHEDVFKKMKIVLGKWEKENRLLHQPTVYDQSDAEKAALIKLGYW